MNYTIKNYKDEEMATATEKRKAIKLCKLYALEKRQTMFLYSEKGYIAAAEFPNYLRNCKLDIHDIKMIDLPF